MKKFTYTLLFVAIAGFLFVCEVVGGTYEADFIPWSGYWWPYTEGGVVRGAGYRRSPSPLEKYDYVTIGVYKGPAASYGLKTYYDKDALYWEGMCYNWAAASILEDEPIHKGIYNNTTFYVGDKKALLTVAYHGVLTNEYLIRSPEDFHEILEKFIRDQKVPVMIDLGSNGEIWFYPVYKYETEYNQIGNTRHYRTTISFANDAVDPDFVGTYESKALYEYYFLLGPSGEIIETGWEGNSVSEPPIKAVEPLGTVPVNPGMDYNTVKEIAYTDDDKFIGNNVIEQAADLSTGTNKLLGLDSDFFKMNAQPGDILNIQLQADDDGEVTLRAYSDSFEYGELKREGQLEIETQRSEDIILEVIPSIASDEPEYSLYLRRMLSFQQIFPVNPGGFWENGIAILHYDQPVGRTIISTVNNDGFPVSSYTDQSNHIQLMGSLEEKFNLPASGGYVRIDSDTPIEGLLASVNGKEYLIGGDSMPGDFGSNEIFFPHIAKTDGWLTFLGMINLGPNAETIEVTSFGPEGILLGTENVELKAGEKIETNSGSSSLLHRDARSGMARTISGKDSIIGYLTFYNPTIASKGRDVIPMSVEGYTEIIAPQVACDADWNTGLGVMNTSKSDSLIRIVAYDRLGNTIDELEKNLKPRENFVQDLRTLLPGYPPEEFASLRIIASVEKSLNGFVLYESKDRQSLAGVTLQPPLDWPLHLPHIASVDSWWTGVSVMNAGGQQTDLAITLFDQNNDRLAEKNFLLLPNQKVCDTVRGLFEGEMVDFSNARFLKIESNQGQPLSGMYLIGSDGSRLIGGNLR